MSCGAALGLFLVLCGMGVDPLTHAYVRWLISGGNHSHLLWHGPMAWLFWGLTALTLVGPFLMALVWRAYARKP
jgi:hypothetical protein